MRPDEVVFLAVVASGVLENGLVSVPLVPQMRVQTLIEHVDDYYGETCEGERED